IYRAFFAMIARPLTTRRGENSSAAWGVTNFMLRLLERRRPDYIAWVQDVGESFRHQVYPGYKATREKLTQELQQEFDRSLERIAGKRAREAVQQHADLARLSRDLVTIRRDVPLSLDLQQLRVRPPDVARLSELFTELEFRTLIPKLASVSVAAAGDLDVAETRAPPSPSPPLPPLAGPPSGLPGAIRDDQAD